jgi:hypothetical protein
LAANAALSTDGLAADGEELLKPLSNAQAELARSPGSGVSAWFSVLAAGQASGGLNLWRPRSEQQGVTRNTRDAAADSIGGAGATNTFVDPSFDSRKAAWRFASPVGTDRARDRLALPAPRLARSPAERAAGAGAAAAQRQGLVGSRSRLEVAGGGSAGPGANAFARLAASSASGSAQRRARPAQRGQITRGLLGCGPTCWAAWRAAAARSTGACSATWATMRASLLVAMVPAYPRGGPSAATPYGTRDRARLTANLIRVQATDWHRCSARSPIAPTRSRGVCSLGRPASRRGRSLLVTAADLEIERRRGAWPSAGRVGVLGEEQNGRGQRGHPARDRPHRRDLQLRPRDPVFATLLAIGRTARWSPAWWCARAPRRARSPARGWRRLRGGLEVRELAPAQLFPAASGVRGRVHAPGLVRWRAPPPAAASATLAALPGAAGTGGSLRPIVHPWDIAALRSWSRRRAGARRRCGERSTRAAWSRQRPLHGARSVLRSDT